ncbi:hypothetical protein PGT21_007941 [Puccinia graminis f. sp. tritici]|uniref:Uncharacterized protein n=1 Tax=Puccinia graminis f. sp. tritici TaxID=56615 RepID=A0A5B0NBG8_PUCGR|nr:hypothetical protein PGT21_007941 [Puccinia graminis f. sp. tritici]KAA1122960.1 hypothetical protein PGTUg99_008719 [Puccinia graminis f. sp. tritici]
MDVDCSMEKAAWRGALNGGYDKLRGFDLESVYHYPFVGDRSAALGPGWPGQNRSARTPRLSVGCGLARKQDPPICETESTTERLSGGFCSSNMGGDLDG